MAQAVVTVSPVPDGVTLGEVFDGNDDVTHKIAGSMEQGAWSQSISREQGARSMEQGAWSWEPDSESR
jgi:hypothetical protein